MIHNTTEHKYVKMSSVIGIQDVPGGMCQTSGKCSLC